VFATIFALAILSATVLTVAFAGNSKSPAKPRAVHAKVLMSGKSTAAGSHAARPASRTAGVRARTGVDPDEQTGENEAAGDATVDGVEQAPGAEHQCPPDCAPGEKP
jgi:hypothetical protein